MQISRLKLHTDDEGNVIVHPLTEFGIGEVGGAVLLLAARYATTPEQLETSEQSQIQLAVSIPIAVELAHQLLRAAEALQAQVTPPGSPIQ